MSEQKKSLMPTANHFFMKPFKQMNHLLVFASIWMIFPSLAQTGQKYLYLENTVNNKVKRLNLENASYFNICIDSLNGSFEGNRTYFSYNPSESVFGTNEVIFKFSEYSAYEGYYTNDESFYYKEDYMQLMV